MDLDSDSDIEIVYPPNHPRQPCSHLAPRLPPQPSLAHPFLSEREHGPTPIPVPKKSRTPIRVETDSSLSGGSEDLSEPGSPIPVRQCKRPGGPQPHAIVSSEIDSVDRSPSPFADEATLRPHDFIRPSSGEVERESSGSPIPVRKRPRPTPASAAEVSDALSPCESSDGGSPIPMRKSIRTRSPLLLSSDSDTDPLSPISRFGRLFDASPLGQGAALGPGPSSENASTQLTRSPAPVVLSDDLARSAQPIEDELDEWNDLLESDKAPAKYVPRSQPLRPASVPVEALEGEHEARLWLASAPADMPAGATMEHEEGTLARTYSAPQPINTIPTSARDKGKGRLVERALTPDSSWESAPAAKTAPLKRPTAADRQRASTSKVVAGESPMAPDDKSVSSLESRLPSIASKSRPAPSPAEDRRSASLGWQSGMMSDDSVSSVEARALSIASTPTLHRSHLPAENLFEEDGLFPWELAAGLESEAVVGGQTVSSPRSSAPAVVSSSAPVPAPSSKKQTKGMGRAEKMAKAQQAKLAREAVKAAKQEEMQQRKMHREANKLTLDRKVTVAEVRMCVPQSVMRSPLHPLAQACKVLEARMGRTADCAMNVPAEYDDTLSPLTGLVRWTRTERKEWDEAKDAFVPLPMGTWRESQEPTVLVVWTAEEIDLLIKAGPDQLVKKVEQIMSYHENTQFFLIIHGLETFHNTSKGNKKNDRQTILMEVEIVKTLCKCFVVWVQGTDELADWLWEMTLEIGVRPYKSRRQDLQSSLRLEGGAKGSGGKGVDSEDTYIKMLTRLARVTESEARAVVARYPTLSKLYCAWDEGTRTRGVQWAQEMLVGCSKPNTSGGSTSRGKKIGKVTSKKIYEVMYQIRDGDAYAYT